MSRAGSDSGTSATPRRSLSALAISSSAALTLVSQLAAALQPSSSRITSGALLPPPAGVEGRPRRGCAAAAAGLGFPDGPRGGEDDERWGGEPQQRQPPRRAR